MSSRAVVKDTAKLYTERNKRIRDAIAMKVPDRVPVQLFVGYFAAKYCGLPFSTVYYDARKWRAANRRTIVELQPDAYWVQTATVSGKALELLSPLQIKWPGFGLPENQSHQMIELEPMRADEYGAYLRDPSGYILRTYLPRVMESAAPLATLSPFRSLIGGTGMAFYLAQFTRPEMVAMLQRFQKAAKLQAKWQTIDVNFTEELAELGFPSYNTPRMMGGAPFDMISDNLRGMRGAMLDMYRNQDQLLELCESLGRQTVEMIKQMPPPAKGAVNRVFMALHRGSDGFMSLPQFKKFYWPGLKKVILSLIEAGWTPCPFFEGTWDQRLEFIRELPRGKVLCHFAQTDPAKAKAVLGGHLCFMIDVPGSILQAGSVTDVENYCKKLIDICGKDGGFIMTATCLDEAKPENVKAMIDITKRYGRYS